MSRPILILQMQRMGDLLLSFPLLLWLARLYPERPLWLVAEKTFSEPLMPLSPQAAYIPWERAEALANERFELVLNLSHRPEAAALATRLTADEHLGPLHIEGRGTYIRGQWQLYRAALTHCNRHNRFHWAELNALDLVPLETIRATRWEPPRHLGRHARSVGLFLGASERHKRPSATFWAKLVRELRRRGWNPVLLGGPGEAELGARVAALYGEPLQSLCGRLSLAQLAAFGQRLQLLITPDTGPMHLAAWTGTHVLNLSMGPVSAWETGPYQPGHAVLRSSRSCVGCWSCSREPWPCHESMHPGRVALVAETLIQGGAKSQVRLRTPGQQLLTTGRDARGLYDLQPTAGRAAIAREAVGRFWQAFFLYALDAEKGAQAATAAWRRVAEAAPDLHAAVGQRLPRLGATFKRGLAGELGDDFWAAQPPVLRPLCSYLQLLLQNGDHSPEAGRRALGLTERFLDVATSARV